MADLQDEDQSGSARTLDVSKYVRDAKKVMSAMVVTKDRQIIPKVKCKIHVPTRFMESAVELGGLGVNNFVYGFVAIVLEDNTYALLSLVGMISVNPAMVTRVMIEDTEYYELHFNANEPMITSIDIVKRQTMIYFVVKEIWLMGHVPWYADYSDVAKIFATAKSHADSGVGKSPEVVEFLTSLIARPKGDRETLLRLAVKTARDADHRKIEYVPLESVFYSVDSTLNKLTGAYFKQGLVSALVKPADRMDKIESILRA